MNKGYIINPANPKKDMAFIANDIMNNWLLQVGDKLFRICELEFYLKHQPDHDDPYIHGKEIQKEYGKWYFHGSGLDMTIGNGDYMASILLRAIEDIQTENGYFYGPLNLVSELFKCFDSCSVHNLAFGLISSEGFEIEYEKPIAAKRVGLNSKKDKYQMHDALYRFLIRPEKKHADKTGIAETMKQSGQYTDEEIKGIWG